MQVLVDTSVWIDYFRTGENSQALDSLLDVDSAAVNDLILTELIPFLRIRNQAAIIKLLNKLTRIQLAVNWAEIQNLQFSCLQAGINGVGIPDLLIIQNARQSGVSIFSLDKHFKLMRSILNFETYP